MSEINRADPNSIYAIEGKSPAFTWPEREAVSDDDIDAALGAGVPGGASVYCWLPMVDGHTVHQTARDVMRAAIAAVDKHRSMSPTSETDQLGGVGV